MKILKISIDLASWHPVSKENSKVKDRYGEPERGGVNGSR
jgi:hypothetical protein